MVLARKSIRQSYTPSKEVLSIVQEYRRMTNDAIRIGITNDNLSNMKKLCNLSYRELKRYSVPSCYKLCAISKAAGILASRKKSIKRVWRNQKTGRIQGSLAGHSCYSPDQRRNQGNITAVREVRGETPISIIG